MPIKKNLDEKLNTLNTHIDQLETCGADFDQATDIYGKAIKLAGETLKDLNKVEQHIKILHEEAEETLKLADLNQPE
eukprot:COSAG01_NODE_1_length_100484_cov_170.446142_57_plen_77_part_00